MQKNGLPQDIVVTFCKYNFCCLRESWMFIIKMFYSRKVENVFCETYKSLHFEITLFDLLQMASLSVQSTVVGKVEIDYFSIFDFLDPG